MCSDSSAGLQLPTRARALREGSGLGQIPPFEWLEGQREKSIYQKALNVLF